MTIDHYTLKFIATLIIVSFIGAPRLSDAKAISQTLTPPKTFTQWCQRQKSFITTIRKTIDVLLQTANTTDCQLADTKLQSLTELNLNFQGLTNIEPLASFHNLKKLYLLGNDLGNLQPLSKLNKLVELDLGINGIQDIEPIGELSNLTTLNLAGNQVRSVGVLSSLSKLNILSLGSNQISNINSLADVQNLTQLYLYSNQITDIQALSKLRKLTVLNIHANPILEKDCPVQPTSICHF
jgi:internalin A